MDAKRYVIAGVGPGFDGMVATGLPTHAPWFNPADFVDVSRFSNPNLVIGDREAGVPVPEGSFLIAKKYLAEAKSDACEYASDNPFGAYRCETRVKSRDGIEVILVEHERATLATILEHGKNGWSKTVYSQNFFGNSEEIVSVVRQAAAEGDLDQIVFALRALDALERRGNEEKEPAHG